jgi:hypothetical protein
VPARPRSGHSSGSPSGEVHRSSYRRTGTRAACRPSLTACIAAAIGSGGASARARKLRRPSPDARQGSCGACRSRPTSFDVGEENQLIRDHRRSKCPHQCSTCRCHSTGTSPIRRLPRWRRWRAAARLVRSGRRVRPAVRAGRTIRGRMERGRPPTSATASVAEPVDQRPRGCGSSGCVDGSGVGATYRSPFMRRAQPTSGTRVPAMATRAPGSSRCGHRPHGRGPRARG